jgi:hypothetical protein
MAEFEQNYQWDWDEGNFNGEINFEPQNIEFDNSIPIAEEPALIYPDGHGATRNEIRKKLWLEGEDPPIIQGLPETKTFQDYATIAIARSKEAQEFSRQAQDRVTVIVPDDAILNFIADVHAFHPHTDHERFYGEIETIMSTPKSYIVFGGDLIEGAYWGGATMEQVGSLDEQKGFLKELFKRTKGRAVAAVSGEHDSKWAAKTGADPYCDFTELAGGAYKRGLLELTIEAGDEAYYGLIAHKMRGNSIYNNLHPPMRASREIQGFDYYLSGHTHRKGVAIQPVREKEGARSVAFGVSGPYKETDEYTQRSGWIEQRSKQLYGFALRFSPDEKLIEINEDILNANRVWG